MKQNHFHQQKVYAIHLAVKPNTMFQQSITPIASDVYLVLTIVQKESSDKESEVAATLVYSEQPSIEPHFFKHMLTGRWLKHITKMQWDSFLLLHHDFTYLNPLNGSTTCPNNIVQSFEYLE